MTKQEQIAAHKAQINESKQAMADLRRSEALRKFSEATAKLVSKYGKDAAQEAFNSGTIEALSAAAE